MNLNNLNVGNDFVYGLSIYDKMVEYLDWNDKHYISFQSFQVLLEHKQLMLARYNYLVENGYIISNVPVLEGLEALEASARDVKNLLLYCELKHNYSNVTKIQQKLLNMKKKEWVILQAFLELLQEEKDEKYFSLLQDGLWHVINESITRISNHNQKISFSVYILNDKCKGYVVFSTKEKMHYYQSAARFWVDSMHGQFSIEGESGMIPFENIICKAGYDYKVTLWFDFEKQIYNCELEASDGQTEKITCKMKKYSFLYQDIDSFAVAHENAYCFGVGSVKVKNLTYNALE